MPDVPPGYVLPPQWGERIEINKWYYRPHVVMTTWPFARVTLSKPTIYTRMGMPHPTSHMIRWHVTPRVGPGSGIGAARRAAHFRTRSAPRVLECMDVLMRSGICICDLAGQKTETCLHRYVLNLCNVLCYYSARTLTRPHRR